MSILSGHEDLDPLMHELSICAAIAGTVRDHAGERRVRTVNLRIGHFRQIVPETLAYCWEIHTRASDLEGCGLDVDYVPAVARCRSCGHEHTLDAPVLRCPGCDGIDVELLSGEEFLIQSIDLEEAS